MKPNNKRRLYASLLILGAGILLFRTIRLLTIEDGWVTLAGWVIALTFIEMAIDILCILFSFHWLWQNSTKSKKNALRTGAAAAIFHAFRVLIYVLGRTGPWVNFDVKPEYRETHQVDLFWVYFAAILSVMGILGVLIIWAIIRKQRKEGKSDN